MKFFYLSFFLFFQMYVTKAQLGSWNIYNLKLELSEKWSLFFEPQLRSLAFYDNFHYYEIKGGTTFRLSKTFSLSTGIGDYNTYREGGNFVEPMQNKEIRTWFQVSMHEYLDRIKFEHRYRAEQRFGSTYRNRFRYRVSISIPINKQKIEEKTFYLSVSNELFLGDEAPFFQRNRFFMGFGYEVTPFLATQIGWLNQFDYKINDETGFDFLQISILMDLKWKRNTKERVPTIDN